MNPAPPFINSPKTMAPRILIIEDDSLDITLIQRTLGADFSSTIVKTIQDATKAINGDSRFDLCLLDGILPDGDGIEMCRRIREDLQNQDLPILMLTQRKDMASKVTSLDCGADDYLSKPFEPLELRARIRALFRRSKANRSLAKQKLGPLTLDRKHQKAYLDDPSYPAKTRLLNLSKTEFQCLDFLATSEGQVFSRAQILAAVWGNSIRVCDRNVDSFMSKLRKKCLPANFIHSRYGLGYSFGLEEQ